MSQNVPKPLTCTKQYCHTVLDMSIKGVHCSYHAEQAKSAKKRQQDNKYAQSIIAAPSTQLCRHQNHSVDMVFYLLKGMVSLVQGPIPIYQSHISGQAIPVLRGGDQPHPT